MIWRDWALIALHACWFVIAVAWLWHWLRDDSGNRLDNLERRVRDLEEAEQVRKVVKPPPDGNLHIGELKRALDRLGRDMGI